MAQLALKGVSLLCLWICSGGGTKQEELGGTYKAPKPRIIPTENLTLAFIWMFHSKIAGKIAKLKSVTISIAEKKKLTSLFSFRLQEPVVVSPHSVVIGWQILAIPAMKTIAEMAVAAMIAQIVHTKLRRVSAILSSVMAMLHLMMAAPEA